MSSLYGKREMFAVHPPIAIAQNGLKHINSLHWMNETLHCMDEYYTQGFQI